MDEQTASARPANAGQREQHEKRANNTINFIELAEQFRASMRDAGIEYHGQIVADGQLHRFHIEGHRAGTLNGAYILHLDGRPSGWLCDWKIGVSQNWTVNGQTVGTIDRQHIELEKQRRLSEQRARHQAAADKARYIWNRSTPAQNHPYLTKKHIVPNGTRIGRNNLLLIPLFNAELELINLQFITPDGTKCFLKGSRKKNCFWWIGSATDTVLIAEGFATAVSLYQTLELQVFIAFDAGNLKSVAEIVREHRPDAEIIIVADNDLSGIGQKKARAAALAAGAKYIVPPIPGLDFNDLVNREVI